jgi:hypothetical protein
MSCCDKENKATSAPETNAEQKAKQIFNKTKH